MTHHRRKFQYNDPTVALDGQIYTDFFFGRPHFGQSPDIDAIDHAVILALDEPICVEGNGQEYEGNYEGITEDYIDKIQIAYLGKSSFEKIQGNGVRFSGRLIHSSTGHHHTPVLMLSDSPPIVIDERNKYSDKHLNWSGSGFLLGDSGLIGTAAHVLEGGSCFSITRGLYRQCANLFAIDHELDLALLKIEPRGPIADVIQYRERRVRPTRTWMPPRLGERIYTFGFPMRSHLPHSLNMTEGLVSSELGRQNHQFQMSAAIQPGSSGGPAFDEYGNLIGVVLESLEPAQTLNFCTQSYHLEHFCQKHGIYLNTNEEIEEKIKPSLLAEAALHFCVEVEVWNDVIVDGQA